MSIRKQQGFKHDMIRRRAKVAEMYRKGVLQIDIAKALGVTNGTISTDLKAIHQDWRESSLRNFDEARAEQLAKIDQVEREAWLGWERSVGKDVRRKLSQTPRGPVREKLIRNMAGDSKFLAVVLDCVKKRCDILGLHAPLKTEVQHSFDDEASLEEQEKRLGLQAPHWRLPNMN